VGLDEARMGGLSNVFLILLNKYYKNILELPIMGCPLKLREIHIDKHSNVEYNLKCSGKAVASPENQGPRQSNTRGVFCLTPNGSYPYISPIF
jgi:hypothetical protein